jgi:hypothetical protein
MTRVRQGWMLAAGLTLVLGGLAGCVASVGGYDDAYVGGWYGGGIYEPSGYEYGGWGSGYHVGPPRGGERGGSRGGTSPRGASPTRSAPSIPTRHR